MLRHYSTLIPASTVSYPSCYGNKPVVAGFNFMHYLNLSLKDIEGEEWRDIKDYEGIYQVSNMGRFKSLERVDCMGQHRKTRMLKQAFDTDKYLLITLSKDRKRTTKKPHRIVAQSFIPNPSDLPQVNHRDGNKTNNHIDNLEWCTNRQNLEHAINAGLRSAKGELNYFSILNSKQVLEIFNSTKSSKLLATEYNIGVIAIQRIKSGRQWSSVTGKTYKPNTFSL